MIKRSVFHPLFLSERQTGLLLINRNRRFPFRKTGLDEGQVKKLSLALAIATAPYTLLIPIEWLYG